MTNKFFLFLWRATVYASMATPKIAPAMKIMRNTSFEERKLPILGTINSYLRNSLPASYAILQKECLLKSRRQFAEISIRYFSATQG
ncbi:hypothetical protein [Undibacterium sp. TC9W]|uniref:hypothetical protein n=1 Tax=Undibacterium sp. TC9W TaxID=3413053 RepID=UPI003BF068E5